MATLELRTDRLTLRPTCDGDIAVLAAILATPEVGRWWPGYDMERVRVELVEPDSDSDKVVMAMLFDGAVVGAMQFYEQADPEYRHAGIDLFLAPGCWGIGLAGEAIVAVLTHLTSTLGHHRVVIDPSADNARAIRAYVRAGFRVVGRMRRYERGADGTWRDGLLMEWLAESPSPSRPHSPSVALRTAIVDEIDALLVMMRAFNAADQVAVDEATLGPALTRLLAEPELGQAWWLTAAGSIVGYAVLTYGFDLEFGGRDAYLTELYVIPEARGRGVATAALAEIAAAARAAGAGAVNLAVRVDNLAARAAYRRAGFADTGRDLMTLRLEP